MTTPTATVLFLSAPDCPLPFSLPGEALAGLQPWLLTAAPHRFGEAVRRLRPDAAVFILNAEEDIQYLCRHVLRGTLPPHAVILPPESEKQLHEQLPHLITLSNRAAPSDFTALVADLAARALPDGSLSGLRVRRALLQLGITPKLTGFFYLQTALLLVLREPHLAGSLTRELYPRIAQQYTTTPVRVERDIRSAVAVARRSQNLPSGFPGCSETNAHRITAGVFIAGLSEHIRLELYL